MLPIRLMKRFYTLFLFLLCTWQAMAQQAEEQRDTMQVVDAVALLLPADSLLPATDTHPYRLPYLMVAPGLDGCNPWLFGTYAPSWQLHEGFNAQLSMSVMAGFGKHAPKGVGFGQSGTFAYALPIGKHFSVAAGVYAQNFDWGPWHRTDVGIAAAFGYHINERISFYAYATKSFLPKTTPQPSFGIPYYDWALRDRIGAMAEFKVGQNATIGVSVEYSSRPSYPAMPYWPTSPNSNGFMAHP